jgi:foldase protein PrsA
MKLKYLLMFMAVSIFLAACSNEEGKKVATVNDVDITQGQLNEALMKQYGVEVLESLMTNEIIKQEAKAQKVEITEDEMDAEYQVYAEYYGGEEALLESLKTYNMTKDDILSDIKTYLLTVKLLQKEITLTNEEIQAYYEENKSSFTTDDGEQLAFEDVKEEVEAALLEERVEAEYDSWLDKKYEEYDVKSYLND